MHLKPLKRLLNSPENTMRELLLPTAHAYGAEVFPKVGVKDVLPIENSNISDAWFSYALKAHFDLLVTSERLEPLFAVEFDGPSHGSDPTVDRRDQLKDGLCNRFGLPLARILDQHIKSRTDKVSYMAWIAELYFASVALNKAQQAGIIPSDEPLDPMSLVAIPHLEDRFPLWISRESIRQFSTYGEQGLLGAKGPQVFSGISEDGSALALAVVPTKDGSMCLAAGTRLKLQGFMLAETDAAEEIAVTMLAKKAEKHLTGNRRLARKWSWFHDILIKMVNRCREVAFFGQGGLFGFQIQCEYKSGGWDYTISCGGTDTRITKDDRI